MPAGPAKEVREAWIQMFERALYELMIGMVKADTNEEEYAEIPEAARVLTQQQMKVIARYAAEYLVGHMNPERVSPARLKAVKKQAFAHALKLLADDENKKTQK